MRLCIKIRTKQQHKEQVEPMSKLIPVKRFSKRFALFKDNVMTDFVSYGLCVICTECDSDKTFQ